MHVRGVVAQALTVPVEAEMQHRTAHSVPAFSRHFCVIIGVAHTAERERPSSEDFSDADVEGDVAAAIVVHRQPFEILGAVHDSKRMVAVEGRSAVSCVQKRAKRLQHISDNVIAEAREADVRQDVAEVILGVGPRNVQTGLIVPGKNVTTRL